MTIQILGIPMPLTMVLTVSSLLVALTAGFLTSWIWTQLTHARAGRSRTGFETNRQERLRQGSSTYRTFEGVIERLARWNESRAPLRMDNLGRHLRVARLELPWEPGEFAACRQLESVLVGLVSFAFFMILSDGSWIGSLFLGGLSIYISQKLLIGQPAQKAATHLAQFKERLPYAVDLLALMMESGGGFQESLRTVVEESPDHPLGLEFGDVLREVELGRPRSEALRDLQQRLQDEDVSGLIFAIVHGEEMGTPLSKILRAQTEQMRLKQAQWAEKASAEAQVSIVFPGMLIMLACLIIVVAPFVLPAIYGEY